MEVAAEALEHRTARAADTSVAVARAVEAVATETVEMAAASVLGVEVVEAVGAEGEMVLVATAVVEGEFVQVHARGWSRRRLHPVFSKPCPIP